MRPKFTISTGPARGVSACAKENGIRLPVLYHITAENFKVGNLYLSGSIVRSIFHAVRLPGGRYQYINRKDMGIDRECRPDDDRPFIEYARLSGITLERLYNSLGLCFERHILVLGPDNNLYEVIA